jgi:hypothetical protein
MDDPDPISLFRYLKCPDFLDLKNFDISSVDSPLCRQLAPQMALPSVQGFGLRDSELHGLPVHGIPDMTNVDIPMAMPLVGIFPSAISNGLNTVHLPV